MRACAQVHRQRLEGQPGPGSFCNPEDTVTLPYLPWASRAQNGKSVAFLLPVALGKLVSKVLNLFEDCIRLQVRLQTLESGCQPCNLE